MNKIVPSVRLKVISRTPRRWTDKALNPAAFRTAVDWLAISRAAPQQKWYIVEMVDLGLQKGDSLGDFYISEYIVSSKEEDSCKKPFLSWDIEPFLTGVIRLIEKNEQIIEGFTTKEIEDLVHNSLNPITALPALVK